MIQRNGLHCATGFGTISESVIVTLLVSALRHVKRNERIITVLQIVIAGVVAESIAGDDGQRWDLETRHIQAISCQTAMTTAEQY
jgi:hypothetical protein